MRKINLTRRAAMTALVAAAATGAWAAPQGVSRAPQRAASLDQATIYGYAGAGSQIFGKAKGLYNIDAEGAATNMWQEPMAKKGYQMLSGWLRDGRLCGYARMGSSILMVGYIYEELDILNGQELANPLTLTIPLNDLSAYFPYNVAYNADDDYIYGYSNGKTANEWVFSRASAQHPDKVEGIVGSEASQVCRSLCFNDEDGKFYGVNNDCDFVSIDKEGMQAVLFNIGLEGLADQPMGLTYSPIDGYFLFSPVFTDGNTETGCELYVIKPADQSCELLSAVSGGLLFNYMLTPDVRLDPEAPMAPEIFKLRFEGAETSGSIFFDMPDQTNGGDELGWGELQYTVWVDGNEYESSYAEAGERVSVWFNDLSQGMHVIRVAAECDGLRSAKATVRCYLGADTPKAPQNVRLTTRSVSWDAVTEGVNGGYVNTEALTYCVFLEGEMIAETSDTNTEIELPEGDLTVYQVQVMAQCDGQESQTALSNKIVYGDPLQLDVLYSPTYEQGELVNVIDANADQNTWVTSYFDGTNNFSYLPSKDNAADDWLFLPAIDLPDATAYYLFQVEGSSNANGYDGNYFEVWCGDDADPAAMTTQIMGKTQVSGWFAPFAADFNIDKAGATVVGIHAVSEPGQMRMYMRNIQVKDTELTPTSPTAVTGITAVDASTSAEDVNALVKFTMPTEDISGTPLASSAQLTATVSIGSERKTVEGKPGQQVEVTLPAKAGHNGIIVEVTATDNAAGRLATSTVYCGPDKPAAATDLTSEVSDDNCDITMSFTAPTAGSNGGILTGELQVAVMQFNGKIWFYPGSETVNDNTLLFTTPEPEKLTAFSLGISAYNDLGGSAQMPTLTVQLGKPYALPIADEFAGGDIDVEPLVGVFTDEAQGTQWGLATPADINPTYAGNDGFAMVGTADIDGAHGVLLLPKFATTGLSHASIEMMVWTGENSAKMGIYASWAANQTPVLVGEIAKGQGWALVSFNLPAEAMDAPWVQLQLNADYDNAGEVAMLSAYNVSDVAVGINDLQTRGSGNIVGAAGAILANGMAGQRLVVITPAGTTVADLTLASESVSVPLTKGIYIAKTESMVTKVLVK